MPSLDDVGFDLTDKTALVTGAGRGIGKEIALTLARAGADVVVAARTMSDVERAAQGIRDLGRRALPVRADVTNAEDVEAMVSAATREFEGIDILVNNAALMQTKPLVDMPGLERSYLAKLVPDLTQATTLEDWNALLDANLTSVFLILKAVCPCMIQAGSGRIINITSVEPLRPGSYHAAYSATKWGLYGLTRALALELARFNITVNAVGPGYIYTEGSAFYHDDPVIRESMLSQVPLRRLGQPHDVAAAVLFLASDAAGFITGHQIPVDGGFFL